MIIYVKHIINMNVNEDPKPHFHKYSARHDSPKFFFLNCLSLSFKIQGYVVKNSFLQTAFSAIFPTGFY